MLPHEIEPFSSYHINQLLEKRDYVEEILSQQAGDVVEIPRLRLENWARELFTAARAIERFAACFKDEQETKRRYEIILRDQRLEKMRAERSQ